MKIKKCMFLLGSMLSVVIFTGCNKSQVTEDEKTTAIVQQSEINNEENNIDEKVKESAEEIILAISNGNMENINQLIFNSSNLKIDEEVTDIFDEDSNKANNEGILNKVFLRDSIKIIKINEGTVEYEIESPNLDGIFTDMLKNANKLSTENFLDYLTEYINKAEIKKMNVVVPYIVENERIVIDYKNSDFINAITGGLLESYKQFYQIMLEEYKKEMED